MCGFCRRIEGDTQFKNYRTQLLTSRQMFNRSIDQKDVLACDDDITGNDKRQPLIV